MSPSADQQDALRYRPTAEGEQDMAEAADRIEH
jgi:hypothetical protein